MRRLFIALVVLVVLLIAADRVALYVAEHAAAERLQSAAGLRERPEVSVRGFPFLTQVASGRYGRIDVSAPRVERDGVRLDHLVVHLDDVRAPLGQVLNGGGTAMVRARSADASAVVPYAVIEREAPPGVRVEPRGGELRLTGRVTVFGQRLPASALMDVSARGDELILEPSKVDVAGRSVSGSLSRRFAFTVPLGELPLGIRLTGAQVTGEGLRITASGHDLELVQ